MKKEELRIGNFVNDKHGVQVEVRGITDSIHLKNNHIIPLCWVFPIPLTEEWLKRVSLYSTYGSQKWISLTKLNAELHFDIFTRELHGTEIVTTLYSKFGTLILEPIKYVHELQNLYFVLSSGEELTLKQ